jgi:hypothetical protein
VFSINAYKNILAARQAVITSGAAQAGISRKRRLGTRFGVGLKLLKGIPIFSGWGNVNLAKGHYKIQYTGLLAKVSYIV